MLYFSGYILCAALIFFAGKRLARYGNLLADQSGMSRGWIGLILMASVTSLPELMTGISSSGIVASADLAVGDVLGSCAFNLGILAMLDAFIPKHQPLLGIASPSHLLNAGLGIILITLVGFALFLPHDYPVSPWIGLSSVIFIIVYIISVRVLYKNEQNNFRHTNHATRPLQDSGGLTKKQVLIRYILLALLIVGAALALPYFVNRIAENTGLGKSFAGTFFLAVSTSLPEIAVSVAAVRMGSVDLAVGNLLGSNIFNILILAIDDFVYTKGLILKDASDFHLISVLSIVLMAAIVVIGLSYRAKGKRFFLAWDAALIFLIYITNLIFLYHFTS